jgi:hypothetical protein
MYAFHLLLSATRALLPGLFDELMPLYSRVTDVIIPLILHDFVKGAHK